MCHVAWECLYFYSYLNVNRLVVRFTGLWCINVSRVTYQFKIRKEALIGLGQIYRRCCENDVPDDIRSVSWIRNKVLHAYYHSAIDDKYLSTLTMSLSAVVLVVNVVLCSLLSAVNSSSEIYMNICY